jgi:hypothetical protein
MVALNIAACGSRSGTDEPAQDLVAAPAPEGGAVGATGSGGVTCADIDAHWGVDWRATIAAIEQLREAGQTCGDQPLISKQYAATFNFGMTLEQAGDLDGAIEQYRAALQLDGTRPEALEALVRLNALPEPTPAPCNSTSPPNPDPAPIEAPDLSAFATVSGDQILVGGAPFTVRGVNYFSRHAQWYRFLEHADLNDVAAEFDVISGTGMNTVRLFLWYEPLFTCAPETAIPNEEIFAKVDAILGVAQERNLKAIVTLNDLPDLTFRPLYTDYARYDAQTIYIVRRYRNNPTILAWDLRNEGDLDYGVHGDVAQFSQEEVIGWLGHVSDVVRENDPYHLVTAGWWGDPGITAPYVDILSFHHWSEADELAARLDDYQSSNQKPILLEEVGYHSWTGAPLAPRDQAGQADIVGRVLNVAEERNIAGWLVWTAFDFVPYDGQYNIEHFFGLWDVNLTPKPAVDALPGS